MTDKARLIEVAFPLKQASLDSVHEKNVRHGHISTLHIWPARRPLAACRAALIATLLPDPGTPQARKELLEKIGGKVVTEVQKKKVVGKTVEVVKERTEGGVLHWGNENSPDMDWFREEIRKAYGGRAPRVLDPFAGGGAIPLEAMRLGCEATAIDINPVSWFILKCTLEYPQKLAGQVRPLPKFAVESAEFMEAFLKGSGKTSKKQVEKELAQYQMGLFPPPDADLAWHVRAWGWWVLQQARKDLEMFYPTIDGKPTVAYLWARTVTCKNCRAMIPLLKTRWLCKKDNKRAVLTMEPNSDRTRVVFGVQSDAPVVGGNAAQRREHDKRAGAGTMSRSGATCPCCAYITTMDDLRLEGKTGRIGNVMTAVIYEGQQGKDYRLPTALELEQARVVEDHLHQLFGEIPFGLPDEAMPSKEALGFRVPQYGIDKWSKLFTSRQLFALGTFIKHTRRALDEMKREGYSGEFGEAVLVFLAAAIDRLADYNSTMCVPDPSPTQSGVCHTFTRFAFPPNWDYIEAVTTANYSGGYTGAIEWIAKVCEHLCGIPNPQSARAIRTSAIKGVGGEFDVVLTDPPYYDAISYSDLMDYFYVWLRRTLYAVIPQLSDSLSERSSPKWDPVLQDGELIDDESRHQGDKRKSKQTYEDGMMRAFQASYSSLAPNGRLVVVFANKKPDAWETLVSAMIRSGFALLGSWPIQTERTSRIRAYASAALSSSVWLVCKKRPEGARPGWDNKVLEEMRRNIHTRLRDYWDAGIRGPDFVWAATGPALEAYSKHPVVKKANEPGNLMEVAEFLRAVRRLVVDFVVGRVLTGGQGDESAASGLEDVTTYYILHRHDFGMEDAPAGACILYAVSCNLSDSDLAGRHEILLRTGGLSAPEDDGEDMDAEDSAEPDADAEPEEGTGSTVKLRPWHQRKRKTMGYDAEGRPAPLIDQVHRLMHLWRAGDVAKVDDYLDSRGLRKNALFLQLLQALIELSRRDEQRDETVILENLSNHLQALGVAPTRSDFLPGMTPGSQEDGSDS
jgi:adenine-specific DNA methylase